MQRPDTFGVMKPFSESGEATKREVAVVQQAMSVPRDNRFQWRRAQEWQEAFAGVDGSDELVLNSACYIIKFSPWIFLCLPPSAADRSLTGDCTKRVHSTGVNEEKETWHNCSTLRES
jgi:hypothetical protein